MMPVMWPLAWASPLFDASNLANKDEFSLGVLGRTNLTGLGGDSFGVRLKYGFSDTTNSQFIFEHENKERSFQLGVQSVLGLLPDTVGQIGVGLSFLGIYHGSRPHSSMEFGVAPIGYKRLEAHYLPFPIQVYGALPLKILLSSGRYFTGSQVLFGAIGEFSAYMYAVAELGLELVNFPSYVSVGMGVRFSSGE